MDPEASQAPSAVASLAPGFELPTARQVVGRGLQLALDGSRDIRNASLYVGLLVLAVAGPAALLVVIDLPRLLDVPWPPPQVVTPDQAAALMRLLGPLYVVGALALLGLVTVSIDGLLMVATVLAGRAVGRPLSLREALGRARQVFWRYGFAAFAVGILSAVVSAAVGYGLGALGKGDTLGASLLGTLIATLAVAPFGYILTTVVIGDVDGAAALGRSITLARARPRLALVVAAFAFLASTLQVLGVGVAFDLVDRVVTFVDPHLDVAGSGLVVAVPAIAAALVAFGSLALTVGAVTAAPQITAFLGLTHYSGGLDRARTPSAVAAEAASPSLDAPSEASIPSPWARPEKPVGRTRWVTIPMLALIGLEALAALSGIVAQLGR